MGVSVRHKQSIFSMGVAVATAWVLCLGSVVHADAWQPVYPNRPDATDYNGIILQEIFAGVESYSGVRGYSTQQIDGMPNEYVCDESRVGNCDPKVSSLQAFVVLPPCSELIKASCIEGLEMGISNDLRPAKMVGLVKAPSQPARPEENLPMAGTASLWHSNEASETLNFAVNVVVTYDWVGGGFRAGRFEASVTPYSVKTGNYTAFTQTVRVLPNGRSQAGGAVDQSCVWQEDGKCGVREDFPQGVQARLTIRLDSQVGGWFKGRLNEPRFEVTRLDAKTNRVAVTGKSAVVPQIVAGVMKTKANAAVQDLFSKAKQPGYVGGYVNARADYPNTPEFISAFRDYASDKAQGVLSLWSFGSFSAGANPCLSDTSKLLGLVTTNASAYEGQSPQFVDGSLNYKVSGYHYLPDGSLNLGTYDLIMRKETARCLYGFSSAPISASVSVTSDSGTENVATTNFTEEGDWDHFSAYGFTFSNPKIQVKLAQKSEPTPTSSPEPTSSPIPMPSTNPIVKKVTITCVKGKTVKKVTAVSPKCPAGYRKK